MPFFNERLSKTALYLLENYGSAEKMARMNSASYDKLRCISRGKFSIQQFLRLKELAANTVGVNNSIFDLELNTLLTLYKSLSDEISTLETEIIKLIEEVHPHYMSSTGTYRAFFSTGTSLNACLPFVTASTFPPYFFI